MTERTAVFKLIFILLKKHNVVCQVSWSGSQSRPTISNIE